jgi:MFS family permease
MSRVIAGAGGAGLAGVLASTSSSLGIVFVLDAATFVASALLIAAIRARPPRPAGRETGLRDLVAGIRLVFGSRVLGGVAAVAGIAMFGLGAVNVLLVPFVVGDLGASEAWFGALEAAQVAAMVIAGGLVAAYSSRVQPTRLITVGMMGLGAVVIALAACGAPWQLMVLLFCAGLFVAPVQASVTTLLQTSVEPAFRGRAQASVSALVSGASLASMALAGVAAAGIGVRSVFVVSGLIVAAAGAAALLAFRTADLARPAPLEA